MRGLLTTLCLFFATTVVAETAEKVYYDAVEADGSLNGGVTLMTLPTRDVGTPPVLLEYTTLIDNGPSANRIDIVCVGDGYIESELVLYASHVENAIEDMFHTEPFARYATFFNVHRVDVVSSESGVDNDPVPGIYRDTALDMCFWCSGIERLLCVDVNKANDCASNAPDIDQVFAIANSTMYGGAGYTTSDLATFSGGNISAIDLAMHELGHSLGDLADEYHYGDGAVYHGPEPAERNISILDAVGMAASDTKWAQWLGDPGIGFDGLVNTYEGAFYCQYGIYRPTVNSKMRALGRPFNLPSVEGLLVEFYRTVRPIDDATPTDLVLSGDETVFVDPVDPIGFPLDVRWFLDGVPIAGANSDTLRIPELALSPGDYTLSVTVVDETEWMRDEGVRAQLLTQSLEWTLAVNPIASVEAPDFERPIRDLRCQPNPFNPRTTIQYRLDSATRIDVSVFDLAGRRVRTLLANAAQEVGLQSVQWDGHDDAGDVVAAGVYLCRVKARNWQESLPLVLSK
jgi:hypothetical protein